MEDDKNNLVFLAIGEEYNKQCLFAVLTLLNVYSRSLPISYQIYIYTNNIEFYSPLIDLSEINLIYVNQSKINSWLNGHKFFLRAKICVIKEFLDENVGNTIFVDTDVIFKRRLDSTFKRIAKGDYVLLLYESRLASAGFKVFLETFNNKKYYLSSGKAITINKNSEMWNSGLIGCSSSNKDIIKDVLELFDLLFTQSSSRLLEQLAFSLIFQNTGKLQADRLKLVHYWWAKPMVNTIIDETFKNGLSDIDNLLSKAQTLDPTNRTVLLRFYYRLHPKNILRRLIKKVCVLMNLQIK